MAGYYNENTSYDFSRFRSKKQNIEYDPYSSAAVKLAPEPDYEGDLPEEHIRRKTPKRTEHKLAAKARPVNIIKVLSVTVLIISMLAAVLFCRIENDKMISKIAEAQVRLEAAQSESTRLRTAISADSSYDKIEELARNKLGMVKLEGSQITYFETTNGDRVIVKKDK
ncbi:MAG: hypothetical protein K5756_08715 [Clostridiales bacterium]|nr:hypothetical protein [Clostridiales bacterium]